MFALITSIMLVITLSVGVSADENDASDSELTFTVKEGTVDESGELTVTKNAGNSTSSGEFTYTVVLSDESINGDYGDLTFKDGVADVTFKKDDGTTKTAKDLPEGITYEVRRTYDNTSGFGLFDILLVPMGYVIRICYIITHNYAAALLLFAIVMQIILFPLGIKQQKNMNKQASLRPKENAIRKKYAGRTDAVTQKKLNEEIMALYQQENFNPASGCLPLLIQLPIIFALFAVVRQPLKYIAKLPTAVIEGLKETVGNLNVTLARSYEEIGVISYLKENGIGNFSSFGKFITNETVSAMPDFRMFGGAFDLSVRPQDNVWSLYLLVPILTFVFMYGSMKLTRKLSYQSQATVDAQNQSSMKIMEMMSPLMCTYFAFIVPSAIGIYWMYRNILAVVQQFILSRIYPTPKFTEEQLKEAEREYLGKSKKTKTERDPNRPKPKSLHRIDFDDDDDVTEKPKAKESEKKTSSPLEAAPLKKDKPKKKDADDTDDGEETAKTEEQSF